jgi:hypothetical protein
MSGVWPTGAQLGLLVAALAPEPEAAAALEQVADGTFADNASCQLLPLLYRRWPSRAGQAVLEGKKAYLANWLAHKERMQHVATVTERFAEEGISCMLLKGAAVAIRHYRDAGLRTMRDFDVLVRDTDVARAAEMLMSLGYVAEGGLTASDIDRRRRTRHAWQFYLGAEQSCDLHWRPVVRCFSPGVTDEYWATKEREGAFEVPAASVQLFHICAHALQWDWEPQVRWVADATAVMRNPIDWDQVRRLAVLSNMSVRTARALDFLKEHFAAPVPPGWTADLERDAPAWEHDDYGLMLKPCPLGFSDSVRWHVRNFQRIRPFDSTWRSKSEWIGFCHYLAEFLGANSALDLVRRLAPELRARAHQNSILSPSCMRRGAPAESTAPKLGDPT